MQSSRTTVPRGRQTPGLLGGSCLLLLYLVTATPFAPVAIALLAGMDRSHHVAIQQASQGLQVVLLHDSPDSPTHRHGMLARALTVFAQRTTGPQADHVIPVGAMDIAQQTPALEVEVEPASNSPGQHGNVAGDSLFHAADVTLGLAAVPPPPPAASGLLLALRSTVLLI